MSIITISSNTFSIVLFVLCDIIQKYKEVFFMIIKINTLSQIPLYLQLRNQIVKGIGKGELTEGESLPTVRQMAADLGINTMTVSKSYQLLKMKVFSILTAVWEVSFISRKTRNLLLFFMKNWRTNWNF